MSAPGVPLNLLPLFLSVAAYELTHDICDITTSKKKKQIKIKDSYAIKGDDQSQPFSCVITF